MSAYGYKRTSSPLTGVSAFRPRAAEPPAAGPEEFGANSLDRGRAKLRNQPIVMKRFFGQHGQSEEFRKKCTPIRLVLKTSLTYFEKSVPKTAEFRHTESDLILQASSTCRVTQLMRLAS